MSRHKIVVQPIVVAGMQLLESEREIERKRERATSSRAPFNKAHLQIVENKHIHSHIHLHSLVVGLFDLG